MLASAALLLYAHCEKSARIYSGLSLWKLLGPAEGLVQLHVFHDLTVSAWYLESPASIANHSNGGGVLYAYVRISGSARTSVHVHCAKCATMCHPKMVIILSLML